MKIINKLCIFLLVLLPLNNVAAIPLKIMNVMNERALFIILLSSGQEKFWIEPQSQWARTLQEDESVVSVTWNYTSSEDYKDYTYTLNAATRIPKLAIKGAGGSLVISINGGFIFDDKQGKGLQFGYAGPIEG